MAGKKTPKMDRLVVNAIRRLQDAQGSSAREITNYISQEYDVNGPTIKKQVQVALKRGLSFGILRQTKGGSYTYNQDLLTKQPMEDDGVVDCRSRRRHRGRNGKRRRSRRACKSRRRSHRSRCKRRSRSRCKRRRSRSRRACRPKRRRSRSARCKRRRSRRRKCRSIDVDNLDKTPKMDVELSRHPSRCGSCNSGSSDERQAEEPNQDNQIPENLDNVDD